MGSFLSSASASASTSTSFLPCSSSLVPSWKYDVFISFRGEDTRKTFTSYLHTALCRENIETYIDEKDLGRGDEISPALMRAIEESMISVVVFSENYANSSWCLDELVHILKCKREYGRQVVPVFYKMDPSHVRKQQGNYAIGFKQLQKHSKENVNSWRAALTEAANLAGYGLQDTRTESKLVEVIVEDILKKLNDISPSYDHEYLKGLFGIEKHIKQIESLLEIGTQEDVRMLGIWGMGGIGKTTLARVLFNKFSHLFEGRCFLSNVREESKNRDGLRVLKVELFSELLNREVRDPDNTFERRRVRSKEVLIVLDDVSHEKQLTYLAGDRGDSFGPGSRVIVTTRDKRALIHQINDVYKLDGLNRDDALGLFHWHAFKETSPTPDFNELSEQVVDYAEGNPLALEISGSFFSGREIEDWKSLLERLKGTSIEDEGSIHKILKISYDGLRKDEKDAFLDIACFFNGNDKAFVERLLDVTIIKDLVDKSLVTIEWKYILMHDLVQEMGRKVVHESSGGDLGKLSRIWNGEDAYSVLHNNIGNEKIEAILLHSKKLLDWYGKDTIGCETQLDLPRDVFKKMYNLRLLMFNEEKVYLPEGLDYLPNKLKYLQWMRYPLKSLPKNFNPCNLVVLDMSDSNKLEQLWDGVKDLQNLREINLSYCKNLIQLPDLSRASKLESINLRECKSLKKLPQLPKTMIQFILSTADIEEVSSSSFDSLSSLSQLRIIGCKRLESFPTKFYLKSLREMDLSGCSKLKIFPEIEEPMKNLMELNLQRIAIKELPRSIENLVNLKKLLLDNCKKLELLPNTICKLYHLKVLSIANCSKLKIFPEIEEPMENLRELNLQRTAIRELPRSIENLVNLKKLFLDYCKELELLPNIYKLYHLEELSIVNCSKLKIFPEIEKPMENLMELNLQRTAIKELPRSIGNLVNLKKLILDYCKELELFPNICKLYHLEELSIVNCSKLKIFPEIEKPMENLMELNLQRTSIKELPRSIENLVNLKKLLLDDCKELELLPNTICKLYHLKELSTVIFPEIEEPMENLMELNLQRIVIKELPRSIESLVNLKKLILDDCKELELLPNTICKFYHLEELSIVNCSKLKIFPEIEEPMENLMELNLQRTAIKELPRSIENLVNLKKLLLDDCKELELLPNTICKLYHLIKFSTVNCSKLKIFPEIDEPMKNLMELKLQRIEIKELPRSIENLVNLKKLLLDDCKELELLPNTICKLYHLIKFSTVNCSKLKIFPEIEEPMENLMELNLQRTAIKELPMSIENLVNLKKLLLDDCKELELLPNTICKLYHLIKFSTVNCSKLKIFPEIEKPMKNLKEPNLQRTAIKELPRSIENLVNLKKLLLDDCKELELLPNTICKLYHLKELSTVNCSKLKIFPEIEERMENLMELNLQRTAIKELPRSIENLVNLKKLLLDDCKELELLPNTICKLYHLVEFSIVNCSKLILPSLPPSVVVLDAIGCISLEEVLEQHWFDQCIANLSGDGIKMWWPGHKIPRWFGYQNTKSSLSMKLCLNCFDINCLAIAFCTVVDFSGPMHFYSYELCCQAHCDGAPGGVLCTWSYTYQNNERKLHGDYVFISRNEYFMKKLKEYKANRNGGCTSIAINFDFSFEGSGRNMPLINSQNLNLVVKKCGVYLLYATEAQRRPSLVCCGVPSNSHD